MLSLRFFFTASDIPLGSFDLTGTDPRAEDDLEQVAPNVTSQTDDPVAERKRKRERKKALRLLDLAGLPHPTPE